MWFFEWTPFFLRTHTLTGLHQLSVNPEKNAFIIVTLKCSLNKSDFSTQMVQIKVFIIFSLALSLSQILRLWLSTAPSPSRPRVQVHACLSQRAQSRHHWRTQPQETVVHHRLLSSRGRYAQQDIHTDHYSRNTQNQRNNPVCHQGWGGDCRIDSSDHIFVSLRPTQELLVLLLWLLMNFHAFKGGGRKDGIKIGTHVGKECSEG